MKPEFESIDLIDNKEKSRYELHYNGYVAFTDYEEEDGALAMSHTVAPDELRGTGVAGALVEKAFADIKNKGRKIRPYCSYLLAQIKKHPEWKVLVDPKFENYNEL